MKYVKSIVPVYPYGVIREIMTEEEALYYPMFDECLKIFPATAAEYEAYQRQLADEARPYGCRRVAEYLDDMFGRTDVYLGDFPKLNRHQRKHFRKYPLAHLAFLALSGDEEVF